VTAGDQVNELHLIVAGEAVVERLASADPVTDGLLLVVGGPRGDPRGSVGAAAAQGSGLLLGPGEPAGAMAFFTEVPCLEVSDVSEIEAFLTVVGGTLPTTVVCSRSVVFIPSTLMGLVASGCR
jgi:hypothetical protein